MSDLSVDVEFLINNPEVAKQAAQVENTIKGANKTAQQEAANTARMIEQAAKAASSLTNKTNAQKQAELIKTVSDQYRGLMQAGIEAYKKLDPQTRTLTLQLADLEDELKDVSAAQKELSQNFENGKVKGVAYTNALGALAAKEREVKNAIAETSAELKKNDSIQLKAIGSIAQKNAQLSVMRERYYNLSEAERQNIAVGGQLANQIRVLDKEVNKLNQDLAGTKTGGISNMMSMLTQLGSVIGVTFGVQQLFQFGTELFNIAKQAEGIELAFSRLGDATALEKLRAATKGTVSDLELMKQAVKADDFGIPMDVFAKGLAFAQQKARDTGKDVEYLVNSLVDGIGRKSVRIIDNLNLSVADVQAEFKKTGNFATAVGNIIDREMKQGGESVDLLATKTDRLAAAWANFKKFASGIFNPDKLDMERITALTDSGKRKNDLSGKSSNERMKAIDAEAANVQKLFAEYQKINSLIQETSGSREFAGLRDKYKKQLKDVSERYEAEKGVLALMKEQHRGLEKSERLSKNILSNEELREKIAEKRAEADGIIIRTAADRSQMNKLIAEADALQKMLDERTGKAQKKKQKKDESEYQKALKDRESLLRQLDDLNARYNRKTLTRNEEEIQAIKDQYAKIVKEIEAFNKGNKGLKIDVTSINQTRDRAINAALYRQDTVKLQEELDKQQKIFEDFEAWKFQFGESSAKERFKSDLKGFESFGDAVKLEMAKILLSAAPGTALTGAAQDRLTALANMLTEFNQTEKEKEDQRYREALEASMTLDEKIYKIRSDYAQKALAISKNANGKDVRDKLAVLDQESNAAINAAKDEAFQKSAVYRKLSEQIIEFSRNEIKVRIATLRSLLADSNIDKELRAKLEGDLKAAEGALNVGASNSYENELKGRKELLETQIKSNAVSDTERKKLIADLEVINQQLEGVAAKKFAKASADLSAISGSLGELASSLEGTNDELAYTLQSVSDITAVASNAAGSVASFMSGDIIGGITKGISAIAGVFTIGKKIREMNKQAQAEVQKYYDEARAGELEYQALLRERELKIIRLNKTTIQGLKDAEALLKKQSGAVSSEYDKIFNQLQGQQYVESTSYRKGNLFRKAKTTQNMAGLAGMSYEQIEQLYMQNKLTDGAKTLFEQLQKLKDEGADVAQSLADLAKEAAELWTGTTSDSILDSIVSGFEQGYKTADDFAGNFEELMKKALLNSFKYNVLEKEISAFYEQFSAAAKDGELTDTKIAELEAKYREIIGNAGSRFAELEKVTGMSFASGTTADAKGLSGAIKGMSADQADLLAGQFGGMRMAQLQTNNLITVGNSTMMMQLNVLKANLDALLLIVANTRTTAANSGFLKHLKGIEEKLDASNALRASGR